MEQRNPDSTIYVGNLDERVDEDMLLELVLQVAPVVNVHLPRDKVSGNHLNYGFVELRFEEDVEYAIKVLSMVKVYGKMIKLNKSTRERRVIDVGANIFIGGIDADVDEKQLHDTFSAFGGITQTPKIMYDADSGNAKGYAFISFESFEAADLAIECMNGQYLGSKPVVIQYAFKKDSQSERHGSQAERLIAANRAAMSDTAHLSTNRFKPNTLFSTGDGTSTSLHTTGAPVGPPALPPLAMNSHAYPSYMMPSGVPSGMPVGGFAMGSMPMGMPMGMGMGMQNMPYQQQQQQHIPYGYPNAGGYVGGGQQWAGPGQATQPPPPPPPA